MPENPGEDPRIPAAITLLGNTQARGVSIGYVDPEDEPGLEAIVWYAQASWTTTRNGEAGRMYHAGGGMTPWEALYGLLEKVMDGGTCAHCGKTAGVEEDFSALLPLPEHVCWWVFDPETKLFRRSCEGETEGVAFGRDPRTGELVGRNDPCPCGSGEKWKRCHGA